MSEAFLTGFDIGEKEKLHKQPAHPDILDNHTIIYTDVGSEVGNIIISEIVEVIPSHSEKGNCNDGTGSMNELFFSERLDDIEYAKSICWGCLRNTECLAGAVERREPNGVWGGEIFHQGKIVDHIERNKHRKTRKNQAAQ